jgi:hypothetical protein
MGFGSLASAAGSEDPKYSLSVVVISARNLDDTQMIGTQDPYVELHVGKVSFKTSIKDNGGNGGDWNEMFVFNGLFQKVTCC